MRARILVVDDDADQCSLFETLLERLGFAVTTATSVRAALEFAQARDLVAIVSDIDMPELSGIALCELFADVRPDLPVVLVTGFGSMETAVAAIRVKAFDFLTKPVDGKQLGLAVLRAVHHHELTGQLARIPDGVPNADALSPLVGESPAMERVREMITRVAQCDASVLIQGESGTGKELIARAIHASSARSEGPFVAINCAAVPAQLLESELFGHAKGAFTDAKSSRPGLFLQANGGTLFLDEIGEMPTEMQAKLLRALQERVVRPVGRDVETPFDTRILAASHRNLEHEVERGTFRLDLFYRINVIRLDVPPLRERSVDIVPLALHILRKLADKTGRTPIELSLAVAERLREYDWPGNVRELENCLERAAALARFDTFTLDDLPEKLRVHRASKPTIAGQDGAMVGLGELERAHIYRVLSSVNGNKSRAAKLLGLDRRTLHRKLRRYQEPLQEHDEAPRYAVTS